mgnify:FL=1
MAKKEYIIAPSLLSADFARLGEEIDKVLTAGADWIHFDVMDNHFVPNLTIGPMVCKALRDYGINSPIDVHLMVDPVDNLIKSFAESGASYISFHPEASREVEKSLNLIKESKCNTGLVLNPNSPLSLLDDHWDNLDMVLLMSVNPGFAGQDFISSVLKKITSLREIIDRTGLDIRLEVDGGIKLSNIAEISKAGADTFVAGSAIFNEDNYEQVISEMRDSLD